MIPFQGCEERTQDLNPPSRLPPCDEERKHEPKSHEDVAHLLKEEQIDNERKQH